MEKYAFIKHLKSKNMKNIWLLINEMIDTTVFAHY